MKATLRQTLPLYLGFVACGMLSSSMGAILPAARDEISMSYFQSSFILTGNFLGMLIAVLASGLVADRMGKRPFLVSGGILLAAGLALALFSRSYAVLLSGIVLAGIGFGLYEVAINALCADLAEAGSAGGAMGFLHFFYGFGAMLGPVLVKACIALHAWRAAFGFLALLPILVTVLAAGNSYPEGERDAGKGGLGKGWGFILLVGTALIFYVGAEISAYGWLPLFWESIGKGRSSAPPFSLISPEITATVFWVFLTFGRLTLRVIPDRIGSGPFMAVSAALGLVFSGLWALLPGPWTTLVFSSLMALSVSCIFPTAMAWATSRFPGRTGFVSSFISGFTALAGLFLPVAFGRAADIASIAILPGSLCALCLGIILFVLAAWRVRRA